MTTNDYSVCLNCGKNTTLDDYYKHADGKPSYKVCKECVKSQRVIDRANGQKFSFGVPAHATEQAVIDMLKREGIPAAPGKMMRHSLVDVIAWGCVLIECKSSVMDGGRGFLFGFSPRQRLDGVRAHLTILRCDYGDNDVTYHLFRSDDPVFYKQDGKRKRGVHYQPYAKHRKDKGYAVLTKEIMDAHENQWNMVEQCRCELSQSIASGEQTWLPDWRVK